MIHFYANWSAKLSKINDNDNIEITDQSKNCFRRGRDAVSHDSDVDADVDASLPVLHKGSRRKIQCQLSKKDTLGGNEYDDSKCGTKITCKCCIMTGAGNSQIAEVHAHWLTDRLVCRVINLNDTSVYFASGISVHYMVARTSD